MSVNFLVENNKVTFQGHANNEADCRTITAICDALSASANFETIGYTSGLAQFNRLGGGDLLRFSNLEAQLAALKDQVSKIKSCECDLSLYLTENRASMIYETKAAHEASIALLQGAIDKINVILGDTDISKGTIAEQLSEISALAARLDVLEKQPKAVLPLTLNQLLAKLNKSN